MVKIKNHKLRMTLAILVVIVGIAGIFLPIIPGIALILFGIYMIHPEWVKSKLKGFKKWRQKKKK